MSTKTIGVLVSMCGATLAGHAALIGWQARIQTRIEDRNEVMVSRVVRAELSPLRSDITRAHERIDRVMARLQ
jgi:hypothetical protein